jgi:hypothetical protein
MLLFIATVFLFAATTSEFPIKYINISAASLCFVAILLLSIRFINTTYIYCIEMVDGGYMFYIIEKVGKRQSTVCRIMLSDINNIICLHRSRGGKKQKLPKTRIYNYCGSMFDINSCILYIEEKGELVGINFSPDEKMIGIIRDITQIY